MRRVPISCGAAERIRGSSDTEMREDERCQVDDARGRALDTDEEQRHLRVARHERAVGAAADVVSPTQIGELVSLGSGDEDLAGVRVPERRPGAGERIGMVEDRRVAG